MDQTMRRWRLHQFGKQHLQLETLPIEQPAPGQILVRVRAVALNYRDKMNIDSGSGGPQVQLPFTPASDMAGEVVAVGAGVRRFAPGARVISTFWGGWLDGHWPPQALALGAPGPGMLAQYVLLDEDWAVAAPLTLSDAQASTLPCAGLTAWTALIEHGQLRAGQTVVLQGTGGVALFGLQLAAAHGARTIVISGDAGKLERALAMGATHGILRSLHPQWQHQVREMTQGRGADHVLELVGGENVERSLQALTQGGRLSLIGLLGDMRLQASSIPLLLGRQSIQGIGVGHRRALEDLVRAVDQLGLVPMVEQEYGFAELPEALAHLERGAFGKVVVRVDG
ncbi:zinc-dependent alcohol dehydrogenase family protein [Herbaspirillum sp. B65]|jgi:NADPH:quinone reductase-like Zn-dependent oxidoreductase|uniref:zinc-dependent alcohol dehydrogenase family protein n=1 Tax=Herbaspirillum sp. B65 TaxID=137708 RepID=UPI0003488C10|nr:NAD(P)-dependent alcohol dehydrogenase [Herbaspirillum sp. B65]